MWRIVVLAGCLTSMLVGCGKSSPTTSTPPSAPAAATQPAPKAENLEFADPGAGAPTHTLNLPLTQKWTGDLDELLKHKTIRVLVINSRMEFFYDKGRARGTTAETLQELETWINKKLGNPNTRIKVAFIPTPLSQLLTYLNEGRGDVIAAAVAVTPEREKLVDFTIPYSSGAKKVVVTNAGVAAPASLEDLSGQTIWLNPLSVARSELAALNEKFKTEGKAGINIVASDENLTEDDLLEMVNADLIPATIAGNLRSNFWAKIYPEIRVHSELVIGGETGLAWAMRKNSPQLKQLLDEFVKDHRVGTTFGNTMLQRYLKSTKWAKNSTSTAEMKKFQSYIEFFKKYAEEYNFDYLMLTAQGYQESMLDQSRRSPAGAVGVMQVIPKYAAAKPIGIPNVQDAQENIHAGAKMLHNIAVTYFSDLDPVNRTLFSFAAYNAGPGRVAKLRRMAKDEGLDPNVWFGNVELMAAKDIGQETVQYVSNIYKYYVAYKMALAQAEIRAKAKQAVGKP